MMSSMLMLLALSMLLMITFPSTTLILSKFTSKSKNKTFPFECGFNPLSNPRSSFSIQFFMIAILFLIFDIEIILIFPLPIIFINSYNLSITILFTVLILLMGLTIEWVTGTLKWLK